ncbi:MAG: hypothetical protein CMQ40_05435 [Gammaproteobacteria bacterium]|nr:hypothetical protein [Gammaproteobacteria bacterium]
MKWLFLFIPLLIWASMSCNASIIDELEKKGIELQLEGKYKEAKIIETQLISAADNPVGHVFALNSIITQLTWNETKTEYDNLLLYHSRKALDWCEPILEKNRKHILANFYCGQTNFALSYHHGLKGNYYKAGKYGTNGIDQMETALKYDPELHDAKMQLGLAYYVADNLPPFLKIFSRFLWFIPTGNSEKSIPYLLEAIQKGDRYRDVARYTFGSLMLEKKATHGEAEKQFRKLVSKYPGNPRFQVQLIFILLIQEKFEEVISVAKTFIRTGDPDTPEFNLAKVSLIRAQMGIQNIQEAENTYVEIKAYFNSDESSLPGWAFAWFKLTSAQLHDLKQDRAKALKNYKEILEISKKTYVFEDIKSAAKKGLETPFQALP